MSRLEGGGEGPPPDFVPAHDGWFVPWVHCRTYMTLIGQGKGRTRLQQVMDWCGGPGFDGPLIFDEVTL